MANQYFSKVSRVAAPISDLTISNNLRIGGIKSGGSITKTLVVPEATAVPTTDSDLIKIQPQQSGTTFILTQSSESTFQQIFVLPPAAVGLNYTFIVQNTPSGGAKIAIMPYGYTIAGGNSNPSDGDGGDAGAFSIQAIITIGSATSGGGTGGAVTGQYNSVAGTTAGGTPAASVGGIMFTSGMATSAILKLTCTSDGIIPAQNINSGCRWIGTGQAGFTEDIEVTA